MRFCCWRLFCGNLYRLGFCVTAVGRPTAEYPGYFGFSLGFNTPHYAYTSIMDIFADALASKIVTAGATFRQHDTAIKHFAKQFRLEKLYPTTLTKHMNGRTYPVVLHDAEVMVQSLLKSSLMVEENMLFPDIDNPLAPPPPTVETIADVDTGQVFRSAHGHLCTGPNDVLCLLIMYLDRICIDQHGCCSLEPGYATLGIWNVATRNNI
jgi:hypothetical protein